MKTELSSVDLHFLEQELQILQSAKIEKIYQWGKDNLIFKLFTTNGKKTLRINLPGLIFFTEKNYTAPSTPPGFAQFLRKYLTNVPIHKIYQKEFEKIVVIEFKSFKHGEMNLIIELIKPGNIILCKEEEDKLMTINSLNRKKFKDRVIQGRYEYNYPPAQPNIKNLSEKEVEKILSTSDKEIVKALAIDLGLGGLYAEEILTRSNIKKGKKIDDKDLKTIVKEIKQLLNNKITPNTIGNEVFPILLKSKKPESTQETFSEAIDNLTPKIHLENEKTADSKDQNKYERMQSAQEKRLKDLEKEIAEYQRIGEYIYEHYKEFEILLNKIKELRKTKSFKEIKEILKQNKHFKELNEKDKKITLEF